MAKGLVGTANDQTITTAAAFIPQMWSDEVIATYQKNLVIANLVTRINHKGKKGDTINIPVPTRGSATLKGENSLVKIQGDTHGNKAVLIDTHYEYSVLIEDMAEVQALSSLRRFYTEDAGYALSTQVDTSLFNRAAHLQGGNGVVGDGATAWNKAKVFNANGVLTDWLRAGAGNGITLTAGGDNAIRGMIENLDLADVPQDGRAFILTPRQYTDLLGLPRFTEQAFIGDGNAIKTGKVGMIYGIEVYVTNNMGTTICATNSVVHDIGLLIHKDALCLAEQVGVRSQSQYMQQYLGDLYTADTIYGCQALRDTAGFAFVTARA
jgi:N4-gp56 family major capsid protein